MWIRRAVTGTIRSTCTPHIVINDNIQRVCKSIRMRNRNGNDTSAIYINCNMKMCLKCSGDIRTSNCTIIIQIRRSVTINRNRDIATKRSRNNKIIRKIKSKITMNSYSKRNIMRVVKSMRTTDRNRTRQTRV